MEFEHEGKKYKFSNTMEDIVFENVRKAISRDSDMCKCTKCFYDICAIVLNNLGPPKYGTSPQGELMSKLSYSNVQSLGMISVEIIKAINLVHERPSH
ncbi:MAG: late competence development ComFB family protein [Oscillospiraceae bacterium]|nr:late competence development ComFB family protein [Oscillospiraceae bacterium]